LIYVAAIVVGFALGVLLRWWALAAAVVFGIWLGSTTDVDEVPGWLLGAGYTLLISLGAALGVVARRGLRPRRESKQPSLDR
jgi:hypothetical protein